MKWYDYRIVKPPYSIIRICELAEDLEKSKKRVEREMRLRFVDPLDYQDMINKMKELLYAVVGVLRRHSTDEGLVLELQNNFNNLLKFVEADKTKIYSDLRGSGPFVSIATLSLDRVSEALTIVSGAIEDSIRYAKRQMVLEFLRSVLNRRGLTFPPSVLRKEEKSEEI
ncbi:MAG: hypothetical protein ACTSWZ_07735 [Candidatus Heimdallarchaeaceae archaeon]